ncbi:MAG TPA: patatin-like phospholipase family protein, partial [Xanthomonadales bacterium]
MVKPSGNGRGIVLVLGGGGAAGLAHIGVLKEIANHDIPVKAVVGTSIGAEIGAFFASGMPIDELVTLATDFDWKQTLQLFIPDLPAGGLVSGKRIMDFLNATLGSRDIEDLPM